MSRTTTTQLRSGLSSGKPYQQYSKRIATAVTVFWATFRIACIVLLAFWPSLADGMAGILRGADDVMMANLAFYCGNSVAEKGIVGYFTKKAPTDTPTPTSTEPTETSNG